MSMADANSEDKDSAYEDRPPRQLLDIRSIYDDILGIHNSGLQQQASNRDWLDVPDRPLTDIPFSDSFWLECMTETPAV